MSECVELERYSTGSTAPAGQSSILSYSDVFFHFYSCLIFGVLNVSNDILALLSKRSANNQLEMIWKQAEVAKCEVMDLSKNLRRDSEDTFW